ncbi:MAG: hypothetical protein COB90_09795 [Hyphomicrobiales bacterium]|nr:MAG: hypothetical protein COB90_09795 [Hyphomicrobiales bacterium]
MLFWLVAALNGFPVVAAFIALISRFWSTLLVLAETAGWDWFLKGLNLGATVIARFGGWDFGFDFNSVPKFSGLAL